MRRWSQHFIVTANENFAERRAEQGNLRAGPLRLGPRSARAESALGAIEVRATVALRYRFPVRGRACGCRQALTICPRLGWERETWSLA
jgi:hypothetical protein